MLTRWPINWIVPFFGFALPSARKSLTRDEMLAMLGAARDAGPKCREVTSKDYILVMLREARWIGFVSWSLAATVRYGLTLGLNARAPLHFLCGLLSVLFMLVTLNHAGAPGLGEHPCASRHGRNVGLIFGPVRAVSAFFNIGAFIGIHPH
jgi:hypothetical protein